MDMYYDRKGKPIDTIAWAKLFENPNYKRVKDTELPNKKWVSTVWLGLNHSFSEGSKPLIFETTVFSKKATLKELDCDRYLTEEEALQGHERMCRKWKK